MPQYTQRQLAEMAEIGRKVKEAEAQENARIAALYSDPRFQGPEWTWTGNGWIRSNAVDGHDLKGSW